MHGCELDGLASLAVDADGVIVVPLDAALHAGSPVRIGFEALDGVDATATGGLTLVLRSERVVEAWGDARLADVATELLVRGRMVPELTRALRTLGGRGGGWGQEAFFRPLIEARRRAAAGGDAALDAFAGSALLARIEAELARMAAQRQPDHAAARRALEARLSDAAAPVRDALPPLDAAAGLARAAVPARALRHWREWAQAVQHVFARADAAWLDVRRVLDETPQRPSAAVPRGSGNGIRGRKS